MKTILYIFATIIICISCGKKEGKLIVYVYGSDNKAIADVEVALYDTPSASEYEAGNQASPKAKAMTNEKGKVVLKGEEIIYYGEAYKEKYMPRRFTLPYPLDKSKVYTTTITMQTIEEYLESIQQ